MGTLAADQEEPFDVKGVFQPQRGGPAEKNKSEDSLTVRYLGSVRGAEMELKVRFSNGEELGPFDLALGRRPRLMKCR